MPLPPLINTNIVTDNEPRAQTSMQKFVFFFFNKIARIWGESIGMNWLEKLYYFICIQRESNNVKLYRIFLYRESFEIQKRKRSLENFTQLKTGIISVFENAIKLPADALIVLADTIRRPKNFLIVFFDEKDKNKSVFKRKMAFQHKMKHKTKRFFERNEKRT